MTNHIEMGVILTNAMRLIEEHGWCQGLDQDSNSRFCVRGAIMAAVLRTVKIRYLVHPPTTQQQSLITSTVRFLSGIIGLGDSSSVIEFNDTDGRSVADILAVFSTARANLQRRAAQEQQEVAELVGVQP